jgi:AbrB family looped-hinge helix DNA binding protein
VNGKPETTITSKNQVSLPAKSLRELGWQRGDKLLVTVLGNETLVLTRRPESWTERFAGKMGDVWGDHEDNMRYLDEERASWSERFPVSDSDGD